MTENKILLMKKNYKKMPIYNIRLARGLTQKDIAEAIGTTANQVSRLENGERKLAPEWLERLSKALNCTKAELLGEEPAEPLTDQERALLDLFRSLPDERKKDVSLILSALSGTSKK